jgi:hypothetical protein
MDQAEILARRLENQGLARPDRGSPAEVVRRFGALQAQDLLAALYAIGLRLPSATEASVEAAVAEGSILRSWPLRGTIHFMAAEDAPWMMRLLAPRQNAKLASVYRRAGLEPGLLARAGEVLEAELGGGRLLVRGELYAALEAAGIPLGKESGRQRGMHILGYWAREALICIGPRRGKQPTFGLLADQVVGGRELAGDEALAELALRYFNGHGPATLRDFAWWGGLSLGEARRGLEPVAGRLESARSGQAEYWFPPKPAGRRGPAAGVYLLPPFDEYAVGYADRSAIADPARLEALAHGLGSNIILAGRIAGTWKRSIRGEELSVETRLLEPIGKTAGAALEKAIRAYANFLGLKLSRPAR